MQNHRTLRGVIGGAAYDVALAGVGVLVVSVQIGYVVECTLRSVKRTDCRFLFHLES